jgi:fluoroacetyl-CoA thioesterase
MALEPGLFAEIEMIVQETDTARFSGGESLPAVFSTPRLISLLERTAHKTLLPFFKVGQTSVGTQVNIRHLGATPVGMAVHSRAEILEVDRRRIRFKVEAWDEVEKIAEGEHERFIIDRSRFDERLETKRQAIKPG